MTMDSKKVSSVMDGIPWKIGGDIGNEAVRGYIASNNENGEEIIATLLGIGEKTGVGALFGKKAGSALGGDYLLLTNKKVIVI